VPGRWNRADPHNQPGGPLVVYLAAFWQQISPIMPVSPTQPTRKCCAVCILRFDSFHGMEEVVGSIPTRSTNKPNNLAESQKKRDRLSIRWVLNIAVIRSHASSRGLRNHGAIEGDPGERTPRGAAEREAVGKFGHACEQVRCVSGRDRAAQVATTL